MAAATKALPSSRWRRLQLQPTQLQLLLPPAVTSDGFSNRELPRCLVGSCKSAANAGWQGSIVLAIVAASALGRCCHRRRCRVQACASAAGTLRFRCLPYGEVWQEKDGPAICCDGLVKGATVQLTHWSGNETSSRYYADTSTEIALNFVEQLQVTASGSTAKLEGEVLEHAALLNDVTVVNNHFDTDGVLACWTLLNPLEALARRSALEAAAAVGDFQEWPAGDCAEIGLKLDASIEAIGESCDSDEKAYAAVFAKLPHLIDSLISGQQYAEAISTWGPMWARIQEGQELLSSGALRCHLDASSGVAIVEHPCGVSEQPGPLYHLAFRKQVAAGLVRRYLLVFEQEHSDGAMDRHFVYERPRHAWVQRLVTRLPVTAPSGEVLERLAQQVPEHNKWGSHDSLVGILRTKEGLPMSVNVGEVLQAVANADPP